MLCGTRYLRKLEPFGGRSCRYVRLTTNRELTVRDYVKFTPLATCRLEMAAGRDQSQRARVY